MVKKLKITKNNIKIGATASGKEIRVQHLNGCGCCVNNFKVARCKCESSSGFQVLVVFAVKPFSPQK